LLLGTTCERIGSLPCLNIYQRKRTKKRHCSIGVLKIKTQQKPLKQKLLNCSNRPIIFNIVREEIRISHKPMPTFVCNFFISVPKQTPTYQPLKQHCLSLNTNQKFVSNKSSKIVLSINWYWNLF